MKVETPRGPAEVFDEDRKVGEHLLQVAFALVGNKSGISYESLTLLCHIAVMWSGASEKQRTKRAYSLFWYLRDSHVVVYQTPEGRTKFAHPLVEDSDEYYWPFDGEYLAVFEGLKDDLRDVAHLPYAATRRKYGTSTRFDRVLNDMEVAGIAHAAGRGKKKRIYKGEAFE